MSRSVASTSQCELPPFSVHDVVTGEPRATAWTLDQARALWQMAMDHGCVLLVLGEDGRPAMIHEMAGEGEPLTAEDVADYAAWRSRVKGPIGPSLVPAPTIPEADRRLLAALDQLLTTCPACGGALPVDLRYCSDCSAGSLDVAEHLATTQALAQAAAVFRRLHDQLGRLRRPVALALLLLGLLLSPGCTSGPQVRPGSPSIKLVRPEPPAYYLTFTVDGAMLPLAKELLAVRGQEEAQRLHCARARTVLAEAAEGRSQKPADKKEAPPAGEAAPAEIETETVIKGWLLCDEPVPVPAVMATAAMRLAYRAASSSASQDRPASIFLRRQAEVQHG